MAHVEIVDGNETLAPCKPEKILLALEEPEETFEAFLELVDSQKTQARDIGDL